MSNSVQDLSSHALSYEAREVACHAVEMYTDRLALGADNLKVSSPHYKVMCCISFLLVSIFMLS